jgi:hypothetical protein
MKDELIKKWNHDPAYTQALLRVMHTEQILSELENGDIHPLKADLYLTYLYNRKPCPTLIKVVKELN